jgi:hypothetical protein
LGERNKKEYASYPFEIYYTEHVDKMRNTADITTLEDDFLFELCELLIKHCEKEKAL